VTKRAHLPANERLRSDPTDPISNFETEWADPCLRIVFLSLPLVRGSYGCTVIQLKNQLMQPTNFKELPGHLGTRFRRGENVSWKWELELGVGHFKRVTPGG